MARSLKLRVIAEGVETRRGADVPAGAPVRRGAGLLLQPAGCPRAVRRACSRAASRSGCSARASSSDRRSWKRSSAGSTSCWSGAVRSTSRTSRTRRTSRSTGHPREQARSHPRHRMKRTSRHITDQGRGGVGSNHRPMAIDQIRPEPSPSARCCRYLEHANRASSDDPSPTESEQTGGDPSGAEDRPSR